MHWYRFLYADPTPGALEVFLREPGLLVQETLGLPPGEVVERGAWIKADPIPGCVVCNIGDSESNIIIYIHPYAQRHHII